MWTKLDDGFYDHPKVLRCSLEAIGLYTLALSYCGRHATGGEIPAAAPFMHGRVRLVKDLVRAGLWEETQNGFRVHDWADYNPTREEALRNLERMRDIRSMGGKTRAASASRIAGRFAPAGTSSVAGDAHQPRPVPVPKDEKDLAFTDEQARQNQRRGNEMVAELTGKMSMPRLCDRIPGS